MLYDLRAAIADLDRLNSWVRSPSYRQMNDGPKEAIYLMKRYAIAKASEAGIASHRWITVPVDCRRCSKGRFIGWDGRDWGACRKCGGTGKHALDFVETTIADGPRWHSPLGQFPLPTPGDAPTLALDWKPNTPGVDMEPPAVAACLTRLERWYPERRPDYLEHDTWSQEDRQYAPFSYRLYLGRTDETKCSLCGGTEMSGCGCYCSRGRLAWTDHACKACEAIECAAKRRRLFDRFEVPSHLVTPEIIEWLLYHQDAGIKHRQVVHD